MAKKKSEWASVINWLVKDPRPQAVSQRRIPATCEFSVIEKSEQLAQAIGKNRTQIYDQTDTILKELRYLYGIPAPSACSEALEDCDLQVLVAQYEALHPDVQLAPSTRQTIKDQQETPPQPSEAPILASLELFFQQASEGEPCPIGFVLICSPVPIEGVHGVAVKQGIITLHAENGKLPRLNERAGFGGDVVAKSGDVVRRVSVHQDQGSGRLAWRVEATGGAIGSLMSDENFKFKIANKDGEAEREITDALCRLAGLEPGSVVTAAFRVYVKDLVETEPPKEAPQQTSYSFLDTSGAPLSRAARAVIHRATLAMSGPDSPSGWVTAATAKEVYEDKT